MNEVIPEWFSIKQAAILTNLSEAHIRRALLGGCIVASNVSSQDRPLYRISREAIVAWMSRRTAGALPPPKRRKQTLPPSEFYKPTKSEEVACGQ